MDADIMGLAGMLFVLIIIAMVCGFILLMPISKRLGAYLEQRIDQGRSGGTLANDQVAELRELVISLQAQVESVSERQEFTDRLLAERSEAGASSGAIAAGPSR